MAENQVKRFPFSNSGMVQKLDLNQLEDGQYAYLLNLVSQQEGSLSPRYGYQDVSTTWGSVPQPAFISSMAINRERGSDSPKAYYVSYRTLYRSDMTYSGGSWSGVPVELGSNITPPGSYWRRVGMTQYKTDQLNDIGTVYFASGYNSTTYSTPSDYFRGVLRDDSTYSPDQARYVGILPPCVPALPTVAAPEIVYVDSATTAFPNTRISTTVSGTPTRLENSLGLGSAINLSQQWVVTLASIDDIQTGMWIRIGSLEGIVGSIDNATNSITITLDGTPANGNSVVAYKSDAQAAFPSGGTFRIPDTPPNTLTADLSLSGTYQTGYDSNDFIHFSFYNQSPTKIKNVTLRFYASTSGFYEYTYNVAETAPVEDPSNPIPAYWIEVTVPKSDFTKNGVGSGNSSWQNITTVDVVVTAFVETDTVDFTVGNIFGYGGGGPNSASDGSFLPYDYVYTYLDPTSGAESNPSPIMNPANSISVANQNIRLLFWGTDDNGYNAGITKVAVYRRGGSFTDGAFRRVGLADNPGLSGGVPAAGLFVDTLDDSSIINSKQVEFDNDAPVTSDLNREYVGSFTASSPGYGFVDVTPTFSPSVSDLREILTPGSTVTVGANKTGGSFNQETCTVFSVSQTTFKTFFQYTHQNDEQITWSTKAGMAGDLIMSAFDCLWMAGNPDNPHVLYRSKTGRPESWPVINEATGNSHQIPVTSPDNPIMGLAEFNGEIVCLCKSSIYTVRMDNGVLRGPFKTPANRGLFKKFAWGYIDNGIWFLSYDGIYKWNGATVEKVSFAIDFVFNGKEINGIYPYDKNSTDWRADFCNIQQKGNEVFFNYLDTTGAMNVLRYNLIFDRWSLDRIYDTASINVDKTSNVTCLFTDRTGGDLFAAKSTSTGSTEANIIVYDQVGFYADGGSSAPGTQKIQYAGLSKAYDMGIPFQKKNFTDISAEITSGNYPSDSTFNLSLYYDYSSTPSETFDITPNASGRTIVVNPLNQSGGASGGREARAVQWKISGYSDEFNYWHGLNFGFIPLSDAIKGRVTDWDDLGHPYDKRLTEVTIEYDNSGTAVQMYLDIVSGINGGSQELAKQTITLPAANGRSKITVPINDAIVAKLVRLRPVVSTSQYQIFDYKFVQENYPADRLFFTDYSDYGYEYEKRLYQLYINCDTNGQDVTVNIEGDGATLQQVTVNGTADDRMQPIPINPDCIAKLIRLSVDPTTFSLNPSAKFQLFAHKFDYEQLPKPIVLSTPWNDFGYNYSKIAEQIAFDVNTNGYDVPVKIYGDGSLEQTVTVNGTQASRSVNVTLNPAITFQTMRLEVNPSDIPAGGRFQLWDYQPIFRPNDKGAVYHSFDWDDLGHPYDKKISEVTIEFETNANDSNIIIAIDTLTGIDGATQNLGAILLNLPNTSTGRGYKTFPLPETICKMVRIRSLGQGAGGTQSANFKMWGYKFGNTIPYPADIIKFTEWTDNGYPCAKIFRGVGLQLDTGGVPCTVTLEVDGAAQKTWTVNTTTSNRQVYLDPESDTEINGYLYRLTFNPGGGGKAQLFGNPEWNLVKDACDYVVLDTYNQAFGSAGYTIIKQIWADYKCAGTITLKIYNEDGELFFSKQLPAHATRSVERFYLPSIYNGILNKSKKHRIVIEADDATKKFRWYRDSARVCYLNLSADQGKGYYNMIVWENIIIPV